MLQHYKLINLYKILIYVFKYSTNLSYFLRNKLIYKITIRIENIIDFTIYISAENKINDEGIVAIHNALLINNYLKKIKLRILLIKKYIKIF